MKIKWLCFHNVLPKHSNVPDLSSNDYYKMSVLIKINNHLDFMRLNQNNVTLFACVCVCVCQQKRES